MRTLVFVVAAVAGVSAAQEKRQDDPRVLTVTGCLERSWLKVTESDPSGTHVDKFRLRGTKDVMKALTRDLNGRRVEVTGLLNDPGKTMGTEKTKEVGKKTRIYVGARDRRELPPVQDPILEVRSYRNVNDTCK